MIRLEEPGEKQTLESGKLLTEMDAQYSAQLAAEARDKQAEPERIAARFKDIQGRTEAAIKDQEAADDRAKKSAQDRETATRQAAQETERLRKEREQADEAAAAKELQRLRELGAAEDRAFEQLKRLEAQYTAVKATRDEDTASMLAASLATSQYANEATRLAARIADVQRVEAKLPQLLQSATKQGGWLEIGLDVGLKAWGSLAALRAGERQGPCLPPGRSTMPCRPLAPSAGASTAGR